MRCIVGVFDIFTLDCSKSWSLIVCKTKATRPRPRPEVQDQDQDQDQTCKTKTKTKTKTAAYKTKTKTSFCWSETGLVTRPRSQTTSLLVKRCRYELRKNSFSNRIVNMWNNLLDYLCLILLIVSKTDLMHIGNTVIFYFIIEQPTPEAEISD